jgi:predicted flap endonuclease-1-like 5' DNA nuclease
MTEGMSEGEIKNEVGGTWGHHKNNIEKTGISKDLLLERINHCDLFRIKGVAQEYSDLLEEAGVDTVPELAQRNAENLYEKLVEVNEMKKLVRQLPSQRQVANWIKQAKELPRIIKY